MNHLTQIKVKNTRPLDNGPGGTTGLGSDLVEGSNITLRATFIPIASALDVRAPENQNINLDVSNEQTFLASGLTGSKGYVGTRGIGDGSAAGGFSNSDNGLRIRQDGTNLPTGPNNQEHISLSYRLSGFLLYELTQRSSLSTLPSFTLNNRTYNFGSSNQPYTVPQIGQSVPRSVRGVIDFPLVVSNTGLLWVNRSGKIEFTDVSTIDNKTNTRYDLNINSQACGNSLSPSVTLQNGGKMRAGDDLQGNYANVTVWSGATINVNAGGEATYEGGSNLIVESGGVVNIRDGGLQEAQWGGKVIIRNGGIIHVWNGGQLRQSIYSLLEIENGGQLIIDAVDMPEND